MMKSQLLLQSSSKEVAPRPAHSSNIPTRKDCLDSDSAGGRYTSFNSGVESMRTHR